MIELPTTPTKSKITSPTKLCLVSHQGHGKTTAVSFLPNCLIIDLESGSDQVSAMKLNLKRIAAEQNISLLTALKQTIDAIKEGNVKKGDYVYDYIVIDPITTFEKLAEDRALFTLKNSTIGKGMIKNGETLNNVIADLPSGGGYKWLYQAFEELYSAVQGLARNCIIWIGHSKQGSLLKNGQSMEAKDLAITGKIKIDFLRDVDCCGYLWREGNQLKISFKQDEKDLTIKSRIPRLADKEFVLTEKQENGTFTNNWKEIFPDWIK